MQFKRPVWLKILLLQCTFTTSRNGARCLFSTSLVSAKKCPQNEISRYNGKGTPPRGVPDPPSQGAPASWWGHAPLVVGVRRPLWWEGPLNILPQILIFGHCLTPKKHKIYPAWAISNQKNLTETKKNTYFLRESPLKRR